MSLHHAEELDNDLGAGADEDLTLATALSVDNVVLYSKVALRRWPEIEHARSTNQGVILHIGNIHSVS